MTHAFAFWSFALTCLQTKNMTSLGSLPDMQRKLITVLFVVLRSTVGIPALCGCN